MASDNAEVWNDFDEKKWMVREKRSVCKLWKTETCLFWLNDWEHGHYINYTLKLLKAETKELRQSS